MSKKADDRLGMSPEQWAWFQQYTSGFGEQDEHGVDLSLLRANLLLSPTERLEQHQQALEMYLEMRHAGTAH